MISSVSNFVLHELWRATESSSGVLVMSICFSLTFRRYKQVETMYPKPLETPPFTGELKSKNIKSHSLNRVFEGKQLVKRLLIWSYRKKSMLTPISVNLVNISGIICWQWLLSHAENNLNIPFLSSIIELSVPILFFILLIIATKIQKALSSE